MKKYIHHMSRGYVEFFLLGVFLIGFAFTSGLISKSIPPYMITPSPVLTPQPTPLPPIAPCGQKCGFYFACGAPHSISGKIVDQRGQGVAGLSVIIFDHNRDNPSFLRAIDFATTDASGN